MGVETINANSGGTITSDTLSFYVRDEVGSVIATVTENLGGANQTVALASYDAWGKARPTSGSTAYQDPAPGTFYSPTPSGQEEGYAGHDNLSDTGLVDMEGRVYDPEVGTFLSADPNVQYPFSSQGYDRYIYVNDNPLSLSDPSGYFSLVGFLAGGVFGAEDPVLFGQITQTIAPFLSLIPGCQGWCTAGAEAVGGYLSSGGDIKAGIYAAVLSEVAGNFGPAMTTATGAINWTAVEYQIANSVVGAVDPHAAAALALVEGDYHEFTRGATTAQGLKFAAKYLGEQYVQWKARQEMARVAERNGMNLAEFDAALFAVSELGNYVVGTRYTAKFGKSDNPGEYGFFSRLGGLLDRGTAANKSVGFLFDVTDTLLGLQGLPTASDINAITSGDNISTMTGHSLGAIGVNNLTAWGYVQNSTLDALPFPNVGMGNTVELQIYDGISGSILGWLTNPDATRVSGTCWHGLACGGFYEPPNQ